MVKSRDLEDHLNTGDFRPQTGFFQSGFQTTIQIPDHCQPGTNLPFEYQMVTVK